MKIKSKKAVIILIIAHLVSLFIFKTYIQAKNKDSSEEKIANIMRMYTEDKKQLFPGIEDITVNELKELETKEKIILIDVRDKKEQEVSMIPGALRVDEFEENFEKYKSYTIISYCTIGTRSGIYTQKLKKRGVKALNLTGGLLMWLHEGRAVTDSKGKTGQVHVYGKKWNLLPDGYEGKW